MSDKKDNSEKKPWEKSFEDDRDDNGNYSRSANRRKSKNSSLLTTGLLVVFVAIIVGTIGFYIVESNKVYQPEDIATSESSSSKKTVAKTEDTASSESKVKAESESKVKASSESKAKAKSDSESKAKAESESKSKVSSESASSASSSSESASSSSSNSSVTVEAGQGIYRIAVNNGLSIDQLLELNPGLTASSAISAGQQIRVK
ncbi:SAG1386/EF1546 family surface-associated protein [Dellaglioa carnosa]|uniref:SAG1386/EF1546 family surface-associated protein n=1 Tax=Dellaglioa carnosa TaxID=2995136 RepID=UPI0022A85601|nr:SAG1386/EF1546 family surface-associated protein [Dellaglioa carnosa]MCZ2492560.1 LysM peptidoglycan-binding domain-containing protein [Dellaglioa carnosa]